MTHSPDIVEAVARALWQSAVCEPASYSEFAPEWTEQATALLDQIAPAAEARERQAVEAAFRAGMKLAESICRATAKQVAKRNPDSPVNWPHNCAVFIGLNEAELTPDDIAVAIRARGQGGRMMAAEGTLTISPPPEAPKPEVVVHDGNIVVVGAGLGAYDLRPDPSIPLDGGR